jgi:hypothetical protein
VAANRIIVASTVQQAHSYIHYGLDMSPHSWRVITDLESAYRALLGTRGTEVIVLNDYLPEEVSHLLTAVEARVAERYWGVGS